MTDKKIMKALECCINADSCCTCRYTKMCDGTTIHQFALDLINRLQAEIENLKQEVEVYIAENTALAEENLELNNLINDLEFRIDDLELEIENSIDQ